MKHAVVLTILAIASITATVANSGTRSASTTIVRVSGKEFSFALSSRSGPHGAFIFRFTNRGSLPHDFKIAARKTPLIQPGKTATLTVRLTRRGRYPYVCTVPGHAAAGMKGVFTVR